MSDGTRSYKMTRRLEGGSMDVDTPWVSVTIPCLNEQGFVVRCLDSVIANDYLEEKQVSVVDGEERV
jgi:cellulose synthase/poly-beta-1,6-N-acetylglucosamine synthase-like glycosyltransferase